MRSPRPPAVATWFLTEFGCSPKNDSLIGDLTEEYARGRSRLWYWWQVVVALVAGLGQEVREHKTMAVRALVTGWLFIWLFALLLPSLYRFLREVLPASWWTIRWVYVRGWVLPRPVDVLLVVISCLIAVGIGWSVGRLYRPHHRSMVLVFVASIFITWVPAFAFVAGRMVQGWQPTAWRYDNPLMLLFGALANLLAMICILLGGYISPRPTLPSSTHGQR